MLSKEDRTRRVQMWADIEMRVRDFFGARGFIEVRTPILVASPGMEPNLTPFETTLHAVNPQREQRLGLITSPEYSMKKLIGSGIERAFTITPVFRNQEALGGNHLPEFIMLEWYAPGGYEDLMNETEQLFQYVLEDSAYWPRIPYGEAGMDAFGEPHTQSDQFFLTEFPREQASLSRISEHGFAERFEAFAGGLELCNGFCELTDAAEQATRFAQDAKEREDAGKTVFPVDQGLLSALGAIPHSIYGNAVGLDRLLMLKYRIGDINDIQVFPIEERY